MIPELNVIIETDIGSDADDFMALCWLASAGVSIRAVLLSPGYQDQVALVKFLLREVGQANAPVVIPFARDEKNSISSFHRKLMQMYDTPMTLPADGIGSKLLVEIVQTPPHVAFFACGPMMNLGRYFRKMHSGGCQHQMTIQGGFASYSLYSPAVRVPKMEGLEEMLSFNLNGDISAADVVMDTPGLIRHIVGKNVCHSMVYDRRIHQDTMARKPDHPGGELLRKAMSLYMENHGAKKFHDPVAAVCLVHPEIGVWVRGRPYRVERKWGTRLDPDGDRVLVDIHREALWQLIADPSASAVDVLPNA